MNLEQLTKHIQTTVLPMIKESAGPMVKDCVEEAVKKALQPAGDGSGKSVRELELEGIVKSMQELARAKSETTDKAGNKRQKGEALGAIVRALHKARHDYDGAMAFLKRDGYDDLAELMAAEQKALGDRGMKAMTAGDPDTGGVLIPQVVSQEIIDILRARIVVRRFNPVTLPMPNGNYRLPKKTQASSGFYVGESTSPTTSKVKHGSVLLSFKKLVTVVPASNDLFRFSSPGADQLIRNDIVDSMAVREDQAFLRDAGTDSTPKGLRFWAKDENVFAATGGVGGDANLGAITDTLSKLILKLLENNVPMVNPGWIMSPRTFMDLSTVRTTNGPYAFRDEMLRGMLWSWPFAYSTTVPNTLTEGANSDTSELYLVDFADVVVGDSERLMIDASGEAAYEEGGTVKAAFTRDETVIRAISEHDLVVRRPESVAVARGVRWGV